MREGGREKGEERETRIIAVKYRRHYDRSLHDGSMVVAQWKNECCSVSQQLDREEQSVSVKGRGRTQFLIHLRQWEKHVQRYGSTKM